MLLFPLGTAQTLETDPSPELQLNTPSHLRYQNSNVMIIGVKNVGDAPAHNVTLHELQINTTSYMIYNCYGVI